MLNGDVQQISQIAIEQKCLVNWNIAPKRGTLFSISFLWWTRKDISCAAEETAIEEGYRIHYNINQGSINIDV